MSQRSRSGRGASRNNGTHHGEEVTLWESCRDKIQEAILLINEDNDDLQQLLQLDSQTAELVRKDEPPVYATLGKMETLCRTGVRRQESIAQHIKNLIEQLHIIKGVQHAKEQAAAEERMSHGGGSLRASASRTREASTNLYDFEGSGDSPVPSPIGTASSSRRGVHRDNSIPPSSTDREDSQSTTPVSAGAASATATATSILGRSKVVFAKGDLVAFRPKVTNAGGEQGSDWILGEVAQVMGEGKSRRYKVLDVEPEDTSKQKEYRSSASNMIPITSEAQAAYLPPWDTGKVVLALYPHTTTFYKAEVMSTAADGRVNLRFEGEHDSETMQQVERRFVIEYRA